MRGPTSDWPLALCDHRTIDLEKDIERCDNVGKNHLTESLLLYKSDAHRWYFFEEQTPNEVLLFSNCHSSGLEAPCEFRLMQIWSELIFWQSVLMLLLTFKMTIYQNSPEKASRCVCFVSLKHPNELQHDVMWNWLSRNFFLPSALP